MSRVSDTRQRTREAAAALVADGRRPHELTVDLIYAAIQQGSRTTINDELKLWKDERAKADALGADLPPAIADAMRSLWVAAVEQGEQVFNEQRQALESALETLQRKHEDVIAERDAARATIHPLQQQSVGLQQQLTLETEAKHDALGQVQALQHEVAAVRIDMANQSEAAQHAHDRLTTEFQATIAARDAAFQAERDKANERMEAAQARMLQETDAAREGQRHAEQQSAKLRQRNEEQQTNLTELRLDTARLRRELAEGEARLAAMASVTGERDQLALELAATRGQVTGLTAALQSAEARAVAAENQLAVAHKRRQSKHK